MVTVLPLVAHDNLEQQIEAMERDGYVYFPSVLNADGVTELRELSERLEPSAETFDTEVGALW